MALLQITEPGMSAAPHQHRLAVGIDLGTTNSLVATVRNGIAVVLSDENGRGLLPSIVHYRSDGEVDVGYAAQGTQATDPRNTIVSVKRFMGRGLKDVSHIESMPYDFLDAEGMVRLRTVAGVKSPVEVSAEILKVLRARAEASLGGELVGAVITVPAYFDDAQRQATKDAAKLAGLNVLRLLNEPTAAAIAYGLDNSSEGVYAVFDLGGGTFDISILKLSRGVFEVLATNGDAALGGDDFDQRVYCWILDDAKITFPSIEDTRRLLLKAREAKEMLTSHDEAPIHAELGTGEQVNLNLKIDTFADITRNLITKTLAPTRKALRDAGLTVDDIKGVVMVGGATRMPQVQRAVAEYFKQEPLTNLDPEKVVALGAAMQANVLAMTSGVEASIMVKPSYGLTDDEIAGMLKESIDHVGDDVQARNLREQQVEAKRLVEAVEAALAADGRLLRADERADIDEEIASLRKRIAGNDHRAIKAGIDSLNAATQDFAARRMDQGIKRALTGRKIVEFKI